MFWNGDEPIIHIQGAMERKNETLVGCFRKNSSVFIVTEALIIETIGTNARKALDEKTAL